MSANKYALLSVSDKTGIVDFAKRLTALNFQILSTGGTSKTLKDNNIPVTDVSDHTGFPEMMDGRVKTLHPKIHGGILAKRDNDSHMKEASKNKIEMIDIIAVNLYPFKQTIAKENCTLLDAIENIDIGGPTMIRSAAKNYKDVTVIVDPNDYDRVANELEKNSKTELSTREQLAVKVFNHTADYDSTIDNYLSKTISKNETIHLSYKNGKDLRYGENPHQKATIFFDNNNQISTVPKGSTLHGKEMSYNNYIDADAAYETVKEFTGTPAISIIKHSNPCGLATGKTIFEALKYGWEGDIVSAFGSVIASTKKIDLQTATFLKEKFIEVLIAPGFDEDALSFLKEKSKFIRVIKVDDPEKLTAKPNLHYRYLNGALLRQASDNELMQKLEVVTKAELKGNDKELLSFAYKSVKHVKSNAIMICHEYTPGQFMVLGMGAGQPNRVDAVKKLAIVKAEENIARIYGEDQIKKIMNQSVLASDAFFPFADNIHFAAEAGITKIIQPGGSKRDNDVIDACNKLNVAMAFTNTRHFYH